MFDEILKTECNLQNLTRNCRIKNLDDFEREEADTKSRTFKCKEEEFKCARKRNDHMLHYEQVFRNVSERREIKCCSVLMKHLGEQGEQVIILQMDQRLKIKNISYVPGQICCQCKYLVKDTDSEFTECQTPRKKFQSIGISPVNLHTFTKTLKSNILEVQKVQADGLNNSESYSYDKNHM